MPGGELAGAAGASARASGVLPACGASRRQDGSRTIMSGRRKRAETRHIIAFIVPRVSFSAIRPRAAWDVVLVRCHAVATREVGTGAQHRDDAGVRIVSWIDRAAGATIVYE